MDTLSIMRFDTHPASAPQIAVTSRVTPPLTSEPIVTVVGPTVVQSAGNAPVLRRVSVCETPPAPSSEKRTAFTTPPMAAEPFQSKETVTCCPGVSCPAPRLACFKVTPVGMPVVSRLPAKVLPFAPGPTTVITPPLAKSVQPVRSPLSKSPLTASSPAAPPPPPAELLK